MSTIRAYVLAEGCIKMLKTKVIDADFCVVGGGMAGLCAAISASRLGLKTVLMHERPVLGGNASSEIRMWICGASGRDNRETGILEEIMLENMYRNPTKNYYIWDTVLYDFALREKNLTLLLNCTCLDAETERGDFAYGRNISIKSVTGYQMTTQQYYKICASYYADCSGDSILAPLTGAEFTLGREDKSAFGENTRIEKADKNTMGMSCLIQGRETEKSVKFTPPEWSARLTEDDFKNREPNLYNSGENFWYLELGGNSEAIADTEKVTGELIPLAAGTWDYVKNSGKFGADNWELEFLGFLPGKRESRRYIGEYVLSEKDISSGKIFTDTVCFGGWPLDDHFSGGFYHRGVPNTDIKTPSPYCIPYRSLYSKNVDNLFFAGRNISVTHMALSTVRVMATCALMGQAVGTAVYIAKENNLSPNGVYEEKIGLMQKILMDSDCFIPHKKRDVSKLCKDGAKNSSLCDGADRPHRLYKSEKCGITAINHEPIEYRFDKKERADSVHIVFDSDLNRDTLDGDLCERTHATRANVLLTSPTLHMPKTLARSFVLEIEENGVKTEILRVCENRKRAYHIPVNKEISALRLIIGDNWGGTDKTNIFSFDF